MLTHFLMFKDTKSDQPNEETIIGPSVTVEGDFGGEGNVRVEGTVKGNIKTKQNLQATPTAKIHASIEAQNASLAGEIKGNIRIKEKLEVLATARIIGDIEARTLTVAPGASINGKVLAGESNPVLPEDVPSIRQNHTTPRPATKLA